MISFIVVLAIAISIALGYKTKINTGFFAISFAYIIGCFFLNLKTSEVISMWPMSIFFVIFAVSLFYNFALVNGTLEKLATYLLYSCRKVPRILPFVIFFAAVLIASLGAGFFTVLAFMAPITLLLCEKTGMSKMIGAVAANYGALAGANFMTSQSGIIFKSLIESAGYPAEIAFGYTTAIFISTMIIPILVISGLLIFTNTKKTLSRNLNIEKPEPFDQKQKTTLYLIILMMAIVLAAPVLHIILPLNKTITFINSKIDIGLISIVFSVVALMLKLADEKKVVAKVPWSTLIMICGVGMLISVAIKAGTIQLLAKWIGGNMPAFLVPIALSIVGGIMSFFSSTLGVVTPALFPIIPSIVAATGINPMVLFISVVIGAQATAISPFSSGGSLLLGSCTNEEDRNSLFSNLLFKAVPMCLGAAAIVSIIISVMI
ncbi:SLC13 family permease [Pelosinus fermentans]|uniref:Dicarboxylate carrier MatC domain protein n=1 Tax=Pelosinus fermentans JBW45 TaxID=1192197 RepID=I9NL86_9FIRM|nr:SLC13 family permease [Pelosinus fermentans]AJQ29612.1 Dicarboxylate carrier MatC domain protein [Pelosinus fermentans JBW45]